MSKKHNTHTAKQNRNSKLQRTNRELTTSGPLPELCVPTLPACSGLLTRALWRRLHAFPGFLLVISEQDGLDVSAPS